MGYTKWLSNVEEDPELVSKSPCRVRVFILGTRMSSLSPLELTSLDFAVDYMIQTKKGKWLVPIRIALRPQTRDLKVPQNSSCQGKKSTRSLSWWGRRTGSLLSQMFNWKLHWSLLCLFFFLFVCLLEICLTHWWYRLLVQDLGFIWPILSTVASQAARASCAYTYSLAYHCSRQFLVNLLCTSLPTFQVTLVFSSDLLCPPCPLLLDNPIPELPT